MKRLIRRFGPLYLVAGALAVLAVVATLTAVGGQKTSRVQLEPASDLLPVPVTVGNTVAPAVEENAQVAPAPARRSTGAAQTGTGTTGTAPAGSGTGTAGGGDTSVTIDNGTNDTETTSGGSSVNNNADACVNSGSFQASDDC